MYLDSASLVDIKEALELGCIEGMTTNPTLMAKEEKSRTIQLQEIFALKPPVIFVQILGDNKESLLEDLNRVLSDIHFIDSDKVVKWGIKVPICVEGLKVLKIIKKEYPHLLTLGTAIYTAGQGIMGAAAGCDYLAPYVNRIENLGNDPYEIIEQIKSFILDNELSTKILAASFKEVSQVIRALESGADRVTISLDLIKKMVDEPVALEAIRIFNEDGRKY